MIKKALLRVGTWDRLVLLKTSVMLLTVLSLVLIGVGHWLIVGDVFDPGTGEVYNLFTRWVSDFAAKQPEGWWIKAGILTFCLALAVFFRRLARNEASDLAGVGRGLGVLVMGSLMIGGLIMVAVFDLSPKQYEIIESRVMLDRARGEGEGVREEPKWWEELLDPKGATLREEILGDSLLTEEELLFLREKIVSESWDQQRVLGYLREILRLREQELQPPDEVETKRELRALPRGKRELSKHWYHRVGFQIFLAGFVMSSLWLARREWMERRYERLPGTLLGLCLTLVFGLWLMSEKLGLAGVPQRALLGLIGYWLIRNLAHARPRGAESAEKVVLPA